MKKLILLLVIALYFLPNARAVRVNIYNLCEDSFYHSSNTEVLLPTTVADITLDTLNNNEIPFLGSESGINSMLGTSTSLDSYEVVSDNRMFAYGWCYSVNGLEPDLLMSEFVIDPASEQVISWYFGHAEYLDGEWISYCTPVYKSPRAFICGEKE
jgi:hypothetical protein